MNTHRPAQAAADEIRVTLKVFGGLRDLRDSAVDEHTVPAQTTIEDLWHLLESEAAPFVAKLRDGLANGYLHVLLNGRNVAFLDGQQTRLSNGDVVAVLPPVGGG
jgi:MoaD family protein